MAIVIAASSERPNESSNAESEVALMKSPPVLQRIAAPSTSSSGETITLRSEDDSHLSSNITLHFVIVLRVRACDFVDRFLSSQPRARSTKSHESERESRMSVDKCKVSSWRRSRFKKLIHGIVRAVRLRLFLRLNDRRVFLFLQSAQVFSELAVPRRNHDRNRPVRLRLTGKPNQRLRFRSVDVSELFDLFSFARADVGEFCGAAQHAHPASAARRRTTFDGNRSFTAARIDGPPVARVIGRGAPGQVLRLAQSVFRR